jgi:hypothetical protein
MGDTNMSAAMRHTVVEIEAPLESTVRTLQSTVSDPVEPTTPPEALMRCSVPVTGVFA